MNVVVDKKEDIVMRLVHYFITEENYQPIIVNGVKNEVWLENLDGPYRIIRINTNYIHNNEQIAADIYKTKSVIKQIKKKTLSFKVNTSIPFSINPFEKRFAFVSLPVANNIFMLSPH